MYVRFDRIKAQMAELRERPAFIKCYCTLAMCKQIYGMAFFKIYSI